MIRTSLAVASLLALFVVPFVGAADETGDETVVVRIDVKAPPGRPRGGRATEPKVATSADELAKLVTIEKSRATIAESVDFAKQNVLVFAWAGSGQDRLKAVAKKGEVTFEYQRGLTRDLRPHYYVFAITKGTEYAVKPVQRRRGA